MSVKDGDEVFDQPEITQDKPSLVNQSDEATEDPEYPQPDEKPVQVYNWPVQCRNYHAGIWLLIPVARLALFQHLAFSYLFLFCFAVCLFIRLFVCLFF